MKTNVRLLMSLAVALPILSLFACDDGLITPEPSRAFVASMTGAKERPNPVTTAGTGTAQFTLNATETQLDYTIAVSGMTSAITMAHIHLGNASTAGSVIILLTTPVNGGTVNGSITNATALQLGLSFNSLIALIRNGDAYVNVHTVNNPTGETRGQIEIAPTS